MKTIKFHGELAENFGDTWRLDVRTPAEVFRAVAANRPDLTAYLYAAAQRGVAYEITAGEVPIDEKAFGGPFSDNEVLHVTPVIAGSKSGFAGIILGAAFIAASFIPALNVLVWSGAPGMLGTMTWASVAFGVGANLMLGGLAQVMAGNPAAPAGGFSAGDSKPGYYFNGPTQNTALGSAIPFGYGRMLIGMQPISEGMTAEDLI